ncbi:MAG: alpha/beta fold hydrolase [Chloroflexia bacterium]|nr:alpha/beta fold hydrolase [Chloroflexia bacterium]
MTSEKLAQAIQAAKAGQQQVARTLLAQVVQEEPEHEQAWLWLAAVSPGEQQKRFCLERVLQINPQNKAARRGLDSLPAPAPTPAPAEPTPPTEPKRPFAERLQPLWRDEPAPPAETGEEPKSADVGWPEAEPAAAGETIPHPGPPAEQEALEVKGPEKKKRRRKKTEKKASRAKKPREKKEGRGGLFGLLRRKEKAPSPDRPSSGGLLRRPSRSAAASTPQRGGGLGQLLQRRPVRLVLFGLLAVVVIGGIGLLALRFLGPGPKDNGTPVAAQPTTAPTEATVAPSATPVPATPTPTPTPPRVVYTPRWEGSACPESLPPEIDVECGYVIVPEDRHRDANDTIRLAVAIYHSTNPEPAPDPVLFLQDGPAIEWSTAHYDGVIWPLLQQRDVIVFDQRGTGLSEPALDCPELLELYLQDLQGEIPQQQRAQRYNQAILSCRDRLVADGDADLAAYTSAASAADVQDIANVLDIGQINLYAISYGTRPAQLVLQRSPDIVRCAVLDSPVPLDWNLFLARADQERLAPVLAGCSADLECQEAYPDLGSVYEELRQHLDAEPLILTASYSIGGTTPTTTLNIVVDGDRLAYSLYWGQHDSTWIPLLPKAIDDASQGDYGLLRQMLTLPLQAYDQRSLGHMLSLDCHEQVLSSSVEELSAALQQGEGPILRDLYVDADSLYSTCQQWGALPLPSYEQQALESSMPILLLSGKYDPATPPSLAQHLQQSLRRSLLLEFPAQGHAPSLDPSQDCGLRLARLFIEDPNAVLNPACLYELGAPQFVTGPGGAEPTLPPEVEPTAPPLGFVPFSRPSYGVSGIVPAGWAETKPDYFYRRQYEQDPGVLILQVSEQTDAQGLFDALQALFAQDDVYLNPQPAGSYPGNGLTWRLYEGEFLIYPVDIALADTDEGLGLLVMLISPEQERLTLYDSVFVPVIDALNVTP